MICYFSRIIQVASPLNYAKEQKIQEAKWFDWTEKNQRRKIKLIIVRKTSVWKCDSQIFNQENNIVIYCYLDFFAIVKKFPRKRNWKTYRKNNQNHYYDWPFLDYLQDHPVSYQALMDALHDDYCEKNDDEHWMNWLVSYVVLYYGDSGTKPKKIIKLEKN